MKAILLLALCATSAYAGVVTTTSCGGVAVFRECRIDTCSGALCEMNPGTVYPIQADFVTSVASPSLCIHVTAEYLGSVVPIIESEIPNSSVQPGIPYTVGFAITPSDALQGHELPVSAKVGRCNSVHVEICRTAHIFVVPRS